jgi:predicted RNA-binding protein with PIN domain
MRYLLVDGHSVIFAWPELRKLHGRRNVLAREELIKRLTEYQDTTDTRVVLVFDGQGAKLSEETTPGGIQIFYSAARQTADAIIERLVAIYGEEHEMMVVTSDRLERQTALAFGATTMPAEALPALLGDARSDFERDLRKLRGKK